MRIKQTKPSGNSSHLQGGAASKGSDWKHEHWVFDAWSEVVRRPGLEPTNPVWWVSVPNERPSFRLWQISRGVVPSLWWPVYFGRRTRRGADPGCRGGEQRKEYLGTFHFIGFYMRLSSP